MRSTLIILTTLLLSGCVKQSTSYYIGDSDHTLTLRAQQQYFWEDSVKLTLIAARMPDCQRQFELTDVPLDEISVELFAAGDEVYNLRAGTQLWQVETQTCTQKEAPDANALGEALGSYQLNDEGKLVFEKTPDAAEAAAAAAPAPAQ